MRATHNPQPELNLDLPDQPREVITHTSDEFFSWCDKAKAGLCFIESIEMVTGSNSQWKLRVRWE